MLQLHGDTGLPERGGGEEGRKRGRARRGGSMALHRSSDDATLFIPVQAIVLSDHGK
jgi:hypothetical protein